MKTYSLSPRLKVIADFADGAARVADIGCDHGKISVYLAEKGAHVYAIDISEPSLEKARMLAKAENAEANIDFFCDDGLDSIKDEAVDAVVIAGMGWRMIQSILENNIESVKKINTLILQPMDSVIDMRKSLIDNGYTILDEKLVWDEKRLYTVIKATYTKSKELSIKELILGSKILENNDKLLDDLIKKEIDKRENIINGLNMAKTKDKKMIDKINRELKILKAEQGRNK